MNDLRRNFIGISVLSCFALSTQASPPEATPLPTGADCRSYFGSDETNEIPIHCSYYLEGFLGGLLTNPFNEVDEALKIVA